MMLREHSRKDCDYILWQGFHPESSTSITVHTITSTVIIPKAILHTHGCAIATAVMSMINIILSYITQYSDIESFVILRGLL